MDYKKTKAPVNTVTRDMIAMSQPTGNVYETVCIIGKRANQIAVEMKRILKRNFRNLPLRIIWKRCRKTVSKSKYLAFMRNCQSLR